MAQWPAWHFRPMERGEVNVDPVHDEFFKAQDLADALVRESIQNSLDARRGRSTVRVRFGFHRGARALEADRAAPYLNGLREHLAAIDPDTGIVSPAEDEPMPFLVVEDSGTHGLRGDTGASPESDDPAERNDFHYFWRNVGRSRKGDSDRGRWGLGKAVFTVASKIRTVLGLTLRHDETRPLLMGQSVLRIHTLGRTRFSPYGFFAQIDQENFPTPLDAKGVVRRVVDDFGVDRAQPGLSIIVPFVRSEDLAFDDLVRAVVDQYFYPVTRGDLVVDVVDDVRATTIDARTIDDIVGRDASESDPAARARRRLCELTRWAVKLPPEDFVRLAEPAPASAPRWSEECLSPHRLESLRAAFDRGARLAFDVPLHVKRKGRRVLSSFHVFLEKDDALRRGEHHFIRRGITIPEVASKRDRPVRALVVVEEDSLARLLGDAENPAHSDWSERADKVRALYEHGPTTVRFVKNAVAQLSTLLSRPPAGLERDFLRDLFSIDVGDGQDAETAGPRGRAAGPGGRTAAPASPPTETRGSGDAAITALADGFSIRGGAAGHWRAEAAYHLSAGNPLRHWDHRDFDFSGDAITARARGAEIVRREGNTIELVADGPFRLEATGFDTRRDLVVRLTRMDGEDAEEA